MSSGEDSVIVKGVRGICLDIWWVGRLEVG